MFYYLLLFTGGFLAIFFLRIFRSHLYRLAEDSLSLLNVLLGTEEDDVKLEQMQRATSRTVLSLLTGVLLILVAAVILSLPYLFGDIRPSLLPDSHSALWEILAISAGASVPFFISLKRTPHNYTELSVLLHRLILDNYNIGLKLFKREARIAAKKGVEKRDEFLIVTGLARAGTTSIMNKLSALPEFSSLNYGNMPFLLSPQLWSRIYKPKDGEEQERSHKDGIVIGLRSAEALEEYFFKAISQDAYIEDDHLLEYALSQSDYEDYMSYQAVIRENNQGIYLAKNNNFLLRYRSIRSYNPQFTLLLMFRHPLYHASSLLEKHRQYQKLQQEDPFVLEYMNWLGHHEFGLNQKAFKFEGQLPPQGDKDGLDYWLDVWIKYYQRALEVKDPMCVFIHYEDFCNQPREVLRKLTTALQIDLDVEAHPAFVNRREVKEACSDARLSIALQVYQQLKERA